MRKYISTILTFLFVFAFILLGSSLNSKTVNAYDSGCYGSNTYSVTTGQPCYGANYQYPTNIPGCTGLGPYSTLTGQLCSSTGYQTPVYIPGCTGAGPFSTLTGQPCYGGAGASINQQFYIGQRGADVIALQQMLFNAGFYFGTIDGVYGVQTDSAYRNYQSQYPVVSPNPYPIPCSLGNPVCPPTVSSAPIISGVSGPQSLSISQTGTWTVNAYSNSSYLNTYTNNLTYSVSWGDQNVYPYAYGSNTAQNYYPQQSATFTHAYLQSGTYTAVFTVTSSAGQTAQTSLTVNVGGSNYYGYAPTVSYLSPTFGNVGSQVTIYGTGFNASCGITYGCTNVYPSNNTVNTINFGSTVLPPAYSYNGTSLTFTVPYSNISPCFGCMATAITPGVYPVSVTNSNGTSNSVNFTVTGGSQGFSPTISYLTPTSGRVGTQVTIYGSGLSGATARLNGYTVPASYGTYNSDSQLTFVVPSNLSNCYTDQYCTQNYVPVNPGTYTVSVVNGNGTSNSVNFNVVAYLY